MRLKIVLAALAGMGSAPAHAQLAPGYSGFAGVETRTGKEALDTLREVGSCLARNKQQESVALLRTSPGTRAELDAMDRMIGRPTMCLRSASSLRTPRFWIRGSIADALYRQTFAAPPAPSGASSRSSAPGKRRVAANLLAFSACYAAAEPENVHRLLVSTRIGSDEERGLMEEVLESFDQCRADPSRPIRLDATEVRLALADALWRLRTSRTSAAPQGAASETKCPGKPRLVFVGAKMMVPPAPPSSRKMSSRPGLTSTPCLRGTACTGRSSHASGNAPLQSNYRLVARKDSSWA